MDILSLEPRVHATNQLDSLGSKFRPMLFSTMYNHAISLFFVTMCITATLFPLSKETKDELHSAEMKFRKNVWQEHIPSDSLGEPLPLYLLLFFFDGGFTEGIRRFLCFYWYGATFAPLFIIVILIPMELLLQSRLGVPVCRWILTTNVRFRQKLFHLTWARFTKYEEYDGIGDGLPLREFDGDLKLDEQYWKSAGLVGVVKALSGDYSHVTATGTITYRNGHKRGEFVLSDGGGHFHLHGGSNSSGFILFESKCFEDNAAVSCYTTFKGKFSHDKLVAGRITSRFSVPDSDRFLRIEHTLSEDGELQFESAKLEDGEVFSDVDSSVPDFHSSCLELVLWAAGRRILQSEYPNH